MALDISESIDQIKSGTYGANKDKTSNGFKNGAIVGFFGGALAGWFFRGKVLTYGIIGLIAGGYVGFKISEASELKTDFSDFSKTKFDFNN